MTHKNLEKLFNELLAFFDTKEELFKFVITFGNEIACIFNEADEAVTLND